MRKVVKAVVVLAVFIQNIVAVSPELFMKAVEPKENCVLHRNDARYHIKFVQSILVEKIWSASDRYRCQLFYWF